MDNNTQLKNLLEGPYSHFQNVGTDDFRDPSEKNPALSLSSKGYKNHRTGESGGLQEQVKKLESECLLEEKLFPKQKKLVQKS